MFRLSVLLQQPLLAQENIWNIFPIPAEGLPNTDVFMLKVKGEVR